MTAANAPVRRPGRKPAPPSVRTEERAGVVYVVANGRAYPCASPRIAETVAASLRRSLSA